MYSSSVKLRENVKSTIFLTKTFSFHTKKKWFVRNIKSEKKRDFLSIEQIKYRTFHLK